MNMSRGYKKQNNHELDEESKEILRNLELDFQQCEKLRESNTNGCLIVFLLVLLMALIIGPILALYMVILKSAPSAEIGFYEQIWKMFF